MGTKWLTAPLSNFYSVPSRNGLTKPKSIRGEGYKFINMGEIFAHGRMLNIKCDRVPANEKELESSLLKSGDLLFARQSLVLSGAGKCSIFLGDDEPTLFESHLIRVRPNQEIISPEYLYYYFNSPIGRAEIWSITEQGAGQAGIRGSDLATVNVHYPSLLEQKKIASIFSSLDDKIELNRRMNSTLEAMAQALFKSWFVDFEPVIDNALAAGNPVPEPLLAGAESRKALGDQRKSLPEDLQQQFPNSFVLTDEMGWVPDGWNVGPIQKIADLNPESWSSKNFPQSIKYVDLANTKNGKVDSVTIYSDQDAPSRAKRILRKFDTIIGTVRPGNRSFAYVNQDGLTGFAVMRPKVMSNRTFVYLFLTQDDVIDTLAHLADGGAYPAVRPEVVANQICTYPAINLLEAFDKLVSPFFQSIAEQQFQCDSLSNIRNTLIPKLLSGELRVPEVASIIDKQLAEA